MLPQVITYNEIGLNGWLGRMWKKHKRAILGAAAALIGGPIGTVIGVALQFVPRPSEFTEGSKPAAQLNGAVSDYAVEQEIKEWIDGRYGKFYLLKMEVFKGLTSVRDLTSPKTIAGVNQAFLEFGNLVKFYEYKANLGGVNADLYGTKSQTVQDSLIDFADFYVAAVKNAGGKVFQAKATVSTRNMMIAPDPVNFQGNVFKISIPVFSANPNVIEVPLGDHPSGPSTPQPTTPITTVEIGGGPVACVQSPCNVVTTTKPLQPVKPTVDYTLPVDQIEQQVNGDTGTNTYASSYSAWWKILVVAGIGYAVAKKNDKPKKASK